MSISVCLSVHVSDGVCPNSSTEAVVTFDYDAQQDDELTLRVGQVLRNVRVVGEGWAEGELLGKMGMFPSNFVEMRKASPQDRPLASLPNEDSSPPPVVMEGVYISTVCVCGVVETVCHILIPKGGGTCTGVASWVVGSSRAELIQDVSAPHSVVGVEGFWCSFMGVMLILLCVCLCVHLRLPLYM